MLIYANYLKFKLSYFCNRWSKFQFENSFGNLRMSTFKQTQNQQFMYKTSKLSGILARAVLCK